MSDPLQEEWLKQLDSIGDDLQAGRITAEEADAESSKIFTQLERQTFDKVGRKVAEIMAQRRRRGVVVLAWLACVAGIFVLAMLIK
jgi:hypothetical protein